MFSVIGAIIFVLSIIFAQANCSIIPAFGPTCSGEAGDVWMFPFLTAPIGIPALLRVINALAEL
jgi:hypothetical protein